MSWARSLSCKLRIASRTQPTLLAYNVSEYLRSFVHLAPSWWLFLPLSRLCFHSKWSLCTFVWPLPAFSPDFLHLDPGHIGCQRTTQCARHVRIAAFGHEQPPWARSNSCTTLSQATPTPLMTRSNSCIWSSPRPAHVRIAAQPPASGFSAVSGIEARSNSCIWARTTPWARSDSCVFSTSKHHHLFVDNSESCGQLHVPIAACLIDE